MFELVLSGCTGLGKEWGEEIRIRGNGGSRDRDKGACLLGRWERGKTAECKGRKVSMSPVVEVSQWCLDFVELFAGNHH